MYRWISGKVIDKDLSSLIIETGGIGYKISVSGDILGRANIGKAFDLWLYTAVRENALELYGFQNKEDLEFFELLLTISGIGPKSAMSIMKTGSVSTLKEGVGSGDANYLSKISGIGKKTAEKIILGLKDKIGIENGGEINQGGTLAIEALTALGYSEKEARHAIQKVKNRENPEQMIKEALKIITHK